MQTERAAGQAFEGRDKEVRYFQPGNNFNAERMQRGCRRLMMPEVAPPDRSSHKHSLSRQIPTDMFNDAVQRAIRANLEYVPPYGSSLQALPRMPSTIMLNRH